MHEQTAVVVRAAEATLDRKQKIEEAIWQGVAELQDLILAKLNAERSFRKLECQAAIGEPAPALKEARRAATEASAALCEASLRLRGFRQQLGELGAGFVRSYDELAGEIPAHNARLVEQLTAEWQAALEGWQFVLGRRAAIEGLIGQSVALPEPAAALVDIGDMANPQKALEGIAAAIKSIAGSKSIAERPVSSGTFYDPNGVYKLISDRMSGRWDLPRGSLVVDASFEPGRLAQLLEVEHARPVLERDLAEGATIAAAKAAAIDKATRDKEIAESERRLYSGGDENQKNSWKVPDQSYHPTQADLDRIAEKNRQIAGRSISPGDTSLGAH